MSLAWKMLLCTGDNRHVGDNVIVMSLKITHMFISLALQAQSTTGLVYCIDLYPHLLHALKSICWLGESLFCRIAHAYDNKKPITYDYNHTTPYQSAHVCLLIAYAHVSVPLGLLILCPSGMASILLLQSCCLSVAQFVDYMHI